MRLLGFAIVVIFAFCTSTDGVASPVIPYHGTNDQMSKKDMIEIRIFNQHREASFMIAPNATTLEMYKMAESIGILDPFLLNFGQNKGANEWLVDEEIGKLIRCDGDIQLQDIVPPALIGESEVGFIAIREHKRGIKLQVVRTSNLQVAVHITNGERTEVMLAKATWSTYLIYCQALHTKIMDNIFQFTLCHETNPHQRLSAIPNHQTLEQHLDVDCPLELRLKVEQIPGLTLKDWAFRKMLPKQGLSFWREAPISDHFRYGKESQITAKVEGWTGKLDLKFLPPKIKSLVVKGRYVIVDFKHLKFTSLKELVLDFQSIQCIDWFCVRESQLEILLMPTQVKHVHGYERWEFKK